jgi:hypothetical protein
MGAGPEEISMDKVFDWSAPVLAASSRMAQGFLEYLPQLLGGIAVLLLGVLVAKLLKALTLRVVKGVDRLSSLPGIGQAVQSKPIDDTLAAIIANIVFWLVILVFLTFATSLLGLTMFTSWLDRMIGHLPNIISGALIILAGVVIGNLVNETIQSTAKGIAAKQRALLARGAQVFTLITLIVIGVDQIGVDITVLITVFGIATGALLGGVAIAFSLGARTLVANLIGARYLSRDYRIGETVRIGAGEGRILEISSVAVVLETADGRMTVPAKMFSEEASLLVNREKKDG